MRLGFAAVGAVTVLGLTSLAVAAPAANPAHVVLTLKDHRFTPSVIKVPAGQPIQVTLINQDPVIEEFDSDDLQREETAHPGETIHFTLSPLKAGAYDFVGEFHASTAHGAVIAEGS